MTTGTLLDANLLCLLVVGRVDRASIRSHPRLRAFDSSDFDTLGAVIGRLGDPVLCPHVLAETSNLFSYRQSPSEQQRWRRSLGGIIDLAVEQTHAALDAIADPGYLRLGMADAVLLILAKNHGLALFSDDLHLCLEATSRGIRTINYNYLRDGALRVDQI